MIDPRRLSFPTLALRLPWSRPKALTGGSIESQQPSAKDGAENGVRMVERWCVGERISKCCLLIFVEASRHYLILVEFLTTFVRLTTLILFCLLLLPSDATNLVGLSAGVIVVCKQPQFLFHLSRIF